MAQGNLYDKSPKMERGEDGKMAVKKPEKKKESSEDKKEESAHTGLPAHARHAHERRDMHSRHEMEHSLHDNGSGGDKGEMYARHLKEHKDMHTRHQKEPGATNGSPNAGAPIKEIEKGAKAT